MEVNCLKLFISLLTLSCATLLIHTSVQASSKRMALVIGNSAYKAAPLPNPANDSKAIADQLTAAGFTVRLYKDLKQADMYDAVDSFIAESVQSSEMVFFYAGHAIQVNGKNYLIPVDAVFGSDDLLSRLFDLRYLLDKLTLLKTARAKVLMLDACRDNPFSRHPLAASGLAEITAPIGTFISFSTAPGKTAEDGDGDNSPYVTNFLKAVSIPGRKIEDIFKEVRTRVKEATMGAQIPWEATSLEADFYFFAPVAINTIQTNNTHKRSAVTKKQTSNVRKQCERILAKLSLGMEVLSLEEQKLLQSDCR